MICPSEQGHSGRRRQAGSRRGLPVTVHADGSASRQNAGARNAAVWADDGPPLACNESTPRAAHCVWCTHWQGDVADIEADRAAQCVARDRLVYADDGQDCRHFHDAAQGGRLAQLTRRSA